MDMDKNERTRKRAAGRVGGPNGLVLGFGTKEVWDYILDCLSQRCKCKIHKILGFYGLW